MVPTGDPGALDRHYAPGDLCGRIAAALESAGKDLDRLAVDDLAGVDQLHSRGRDATLALARLATLSPDMRVVDMGGGLGGSARVLAQHVGCRVDVVDLTEQYCGVGRELTARTGLAARVTHHHADALDLPFADQTFDAAWMQHSSMNIAEKRRLFLEIRRVLRADARLAMHEVVAGARLPIHLPVPWAREPSMSFLQPPDEIRSLLVDVGFEEVAWVDTSRATLDWFQHRQQAVERSGLPALGPQLVLGPAFAEMSRNIVRNLEEDRVRIVKALWRRV